MGGTSGPWRCEDEPAVAGSEIRREIPPNAVEHHDRLARQREALPGHRLEHIDIDARCFKDDVARDLRDRVLVGIAPGHDPAPHEILVEAVRLLTGGKA